MVAKHWFEKDGGVAGGCSRTPGKHTVVFCVVAKHWFEKQGGVLCGRETLFFKMRWCCWWLHKTISGNNGDAWCSCETLV